MRIIKIHTHTKLRKIELALDFPKTEAKYSDKISSWFLEQKTMELWDIMIKMIHLSVNGITQVHCLTLLRYFDPKIDFNPQFRTFFSKISWLCRKKKKKYVFSFSRVWITVLANFLSKTDFAIISKSRKFQSERVLKDIWHVWVVDINIYKFV